MRVELEQVVYALHQAVLDPTRWSAAIGLVADYLAASEAILNIWAEKPARPVILETAQRHFGTAVLDNYAAHYGAMDSARQELARSTVGTIRRCIEVVRQETVPQSAYYQDFYLPSGGRWNMGSKLFQQNGLVAIMGVHRGPHHDAFNIPDTDRFAALLPHLRQAAELYTTILELKDKLRLRDEALDAISGPALIVEGDGRVLHMNNAATALARYGNALLVRRDVLITRLTTETEHLHALLRAAVAAICGQPVQSSIGESLAVTGNDGTKSLLIRILPLSAGLVDRFLPAKARPAALVLVTDLRRTPAVPGEVLRQLFALTPAETKVALALAAGEKTADIAAALSISMPTLRTHISAVLHKTDTEHQTKLVGLLARLCNPRER